MKKPYDLTVRIACNSPDEAMAINRDLQKLANKVDSADLAKAFLALEKHPQWLKKATLALKFM